MSSADYLKPFMEVSRALSYGVDQGSVMSLIARRIVETLGLKGCLTKMKSSPDSPLELAGSYGLSELFLFAHPANPETMTQSICFQVPQETLCFSNAQEFEQVAEQEAMMIEGIRAAAVIPIEARQEPMGLMALFANAPREFLPEELNFCSTLVQEGVLSLLWKRDMEEAVEKERRYLKDFHEISMCIHSSRTVNKVFELIVSKITERLGAMGSSIRLLDANRRELYLAQSFGLSQDFISKGAVDAERSIAENMAGKTIVIEDVYTDPRLQYRPAVVQEGIRKILSIPLMARNKVIGVLRIYSGERPPFTKQEVRFAQLIAQQCALAIDNAKIYQRLKYEYQQLLIDFGYEGASQ